MKHISKITLAAALASSLAISSLSFAAAQTTKPTDKKNTDTPMSAAVNPAERAKIEGVVHDYLLQKPEVIVEALQLMQKKQYEQAEKTIEGTAKTAPKFAKALFHQANDPVTGNPNGTVTVVEFFDYQCPHCVDMAPTIEAIVKTNPDVRIIYKDFPIRGPISNFAARAALAANKQGKYYELHHAMLTAKPPLTEDAILEMAKNAGINVDQLKKDMDDKSIKSQLEANTKLAQELKLFGTPAFFIGKTDTKNKIEYVPGRMNEEQMQNMINQVKA